MKKYLLFAIGLFSLFVVNTKADKINTYVNSLSYGGTNLLINFNFAKSQGNQAIAFDVFYEAKVNEKLYHSLVICTDTTFSGGYPNQPQITNINYDVSDYYCKFRGSNYTKGRVVSINWQVLNSDEMAGEFNGSFIVYQNLPNASFQLIDFVVNNNSYVDLSNYSNADISYKSGLIFDEQQKINSNLNDLKERQNQTNQKIDDVKGAITSEDNPNLDGLNNSAGWLPDGPLDSILNLPLSLLENLSTNLSKTCQPVTLPLPYVNSTIELPCVSTIYSKIEGLNVWLNTIGIIASAFILFFYLVFIEKWADATLTLRENTQQDWGGI